MPKTFRPWDVDQSWLLPPSVHDLVPPDHLAHFVRDTVREALDLTAILAAYDEERGYPPYHPGMMVALLLYAYCRGVYSSRQIARACEERVDFMAVTGLAEACLLQQPTMTKLLDRMVRDGLVTREQDARDRRVVHVALTPEGEAKAAELVAAAERYEAEVLARHPRAEGIKPVLRDIIARSGLAAPHARDGEGGQGEEGA